MVAERNGAVRMAVVGGKKSVKDEGCATAEAKSWTAEIVGLEKAALKK